MLLEKKTVFTASGLRDLYKNYVSKAVLAILGLEDQMKIHYAMPVRTMLLDAVDYSNQCKNISQEHRQAKDLEPGAEFLSGMKPDDCILPVLTLVIYYGEQPWEKPESLWDMMDIPEELKPYINNYRIHVFQIRDSAQYTFKHPDNQDFFTLISEFYTPKNHFTLHEFKKKYPDMTVYWETAAAVGAATGTTKLINYALNHKGERLNMCTALQGLIDEGLDIGRKDGIAEGINIGRKDGLTEGRKAGLVEGRDEAIHKIVLQLKNLNVPISIISKALMESFHLSEEDLKKYLS